MVIKVVVLLLILAVASAKQRDVKREFGARGDGYSDDTQAIQNALDFCTNGDEAYFPSGTYMVWPLTLKSNAKVYLASGSTIKFYDNYSIFPQKNGGYQSLLSADDATQITIRGSGTIDGSGQLWWNADEHDKLKYSRPHFLSFHKCRELKVDGIKLTQSPEKHLSAVNSHDVTFTNIKIRTDKSTSSTHGIHLVGSTSVLLQGLDISTGDEHIAIKEGCSSITVKDCVLKDGHGLTVGELYDDDFVTNVNVENVEISGSKGIRIHTDYRWKGWVSHVSYNNVTVNGGYATVEIDLTENAPEGYWYGDPSSPGLGHIQFNHIRGYKVKSPGHFICRRDRPCATVDLKDFHVHDPEWDGFKCMYITGQSEDVKPKFCY